MAVTPSRGETFRDRYAAIVEKLPRGRAPRKAPSKSTAAHRGWRLFLLRLPPIWKMVLNLVSRVLGIALQASKNHSMNGNGGSPIVP
jgi:hypothetical protein